MTKEDVIDFCEMKAELEPENEDVFNYIIEVLEKEPSVDCIDRNALDEALYERFHEEDSPNNITDVRLGAVRNFVQNFPSATPTCKKGKWEFIGYGCYACSECGQVYTVRQFEAINNYRDNRFPKGCPNCATEMENWEV